MTDKRDQLYLNTKESENDSTNQRFKFDERVVEVFNDMISRSVPGYQQILKMLPSLVKQLSDHQDNACHYYDLGCSLGAGMISIAKGLAEENTLNQHKLIGVDNSSAMLKQAEAVLTEINSSLTNFSYELIEQDIQNIAITQARIVLMNFTLQFIPLAERDSLINNIFNGLLPGGALVLSEKIKFDHGPTQEKLTNIHHQFKADQGYSQLEIAKKRDAIENVLIPETLETHMLRLTRAGFSVVTPWIQNLQFVSILAIK